MGHGTRRCTSSVCRAGAALVRMVASGQRNSCNMPLSARTHLFLHMIKLLELASPAAPVAGLVDLELNHNGCEGAAAAGASDVASADWLFFFLVMA
jgi:hypothetical protein